MDIGSRLRELRNARGYSQKDIEKLTGFLCCYVSRVECGHSTPTLENLEKWAKALDCEMYQIFYRGKGKPIAIEVGESTVLDGREKSLVELFRQIPEGDKEVVFVMARKIIQMHGVRE